MKRLLCVILMGALLCGCGAQEAAETLGNAMEAPETPPQREVFVELPGEAAIPAMESGSSRYYICEDYEISLENFPSGDMQQTIRSLSGFEPEALTVVETEQEGVRRCDFVWTTQGEEGTRLGRAAVLDDGNYHYTLSVLRNQEPHQSSQVVWRTVFESFRLA